MTWIVLVFLLFYKIFTVVCGVKVTQPNKLVSTLQIQEIYKAISECLKKLTI